MSKVKFALNEAIILDYFVSALWWAGKEKKFPKEQLSAFYTLMQTLLDNIRGTYSRPAEADIRERSQVK